MQDAAFVRHTQRASDRFEIAGGRSLVERSFFQQIVETAAFHIPHRVVANAVCLAHFKDGDQIVVIQIRRHLGFAAKPVKRADPRFMRQRFEHVVTNNLQRDDPVRRPLAGAIDNPHPSAPQFAQDFEARNLGPPHV